MQRVSDDQDSTIGYVISWGDGTMNSFIKENGVFIPESKGVYSTLTADAGETSFIFRTKSQVRYEFSKFSIIYWFGLGVDLSEGPGITIPYSLHGLLTQ
ncbi:MAG: hypothetical protein IPP79_08030 [Chitinophagaceae bacterium]|nr:hypothetical protein [Chitinophagaceae bacterium]